MMMINQRTLDFAGLRLVERAEPPFPMFDTAGRVVYHGPLQYVGTFPLDEARRRVWEIDGAEIVKRRDGARADIIIPPLPVSGVPR